jgi:hypothetical protein
MDILLSSVRTVRFEPPGKEKPPAVEGGATTGGDASAVKNMWPQRVSPWCVGFRTPARCLVQSRIYEAFLNVC